MEDFPGNSNAARKTEPEEPKKVADLKAVPSEPEESSEPKKVRKVAKGEVKKPPLGKRFKDMFVHDGGDFAEHLVDDVVVPMIKDMAFSIVTQIGDGIKRGFEDMFFGPDERGHRRSVSSYSNTRPQINYQRMSSPTTVRPGDPRYSSRRDRDSGRRSNRVKHIVLHTREEGDDVLDELDAMIDSTRRHACSVADYYSAMGHDDITSTDHEWGWTTLAAARVRQQDDGDFYIELPRPRPLDI